MIDNSWIKYPLFVTIDTNIFISNKYDFTSTGTLGLLANFVKTGKVKVVLSNIVIREVEKHIIEEGGHICGSIRGLRTKLMKTSSEKFLKALDITSRIELLDKKLIENKCRNEWNKYIESINPEILDISDIDINSIIDDYFEIRPPFQIGENKRKEFPDAFIANQIITKFGKNIDVAVISKDNGFNEAFTAFDNIHIYEELGELYDAINRKEAIYEESTSIAKTVIHQNIKYIEKYLLYNDCFEVNGISYDRKGISDGKEYDETAVLSVRNTKCELDTIDEITDEIVLVTVLCKADIAVECLYDDYDNAAWDSENKSYIYVETRKIIENHRAIFKIRAEISKDRKSITVFPFKYTLDKESLQNRFEDVEHYDYDSEIMDREQLGFAALNGYDTFLEENLENSDFKKSLIDFFDQINSIYSSYDDYISIIDDCIDIFKNINLKKSYEKIILTLKGYNDFPVPDNTGKITEDELCDILEWLEIEQEQMCSFNEIVPLPDTFNYGDKISIQKNDKKYDFIIDRLEGDLSEGEQEAIGVRIVDDYNNVVARGSIILTVGFLHFDEDGGASEGLEEDVEFNCSEIINFLDSLCEELIQSQKKYEVYDRIKLIINE